MDFVVGRYCNVYWDWCDDDGVMWNGVIVVEYQEFCVGKVVCVVEDLQWCVVQCGVFGWFGFEWVEFGYVFECCVDMVQVIWCGKIGYFIQCVDVVGDVVVVDLVVVFMCVQVQCNFYVCQYELVDGVQLFGVFGGWQCV